MSDALFFSPSARRLGNRDGVRAASHDVSRGITEALAKILDAAVSIGIFARVMQERTDRLVFNRAVFYDNANNTQQVGKIWDVRPFPHLPGVDNRGKLKCLVEAGG